jgi:hypothetical protein
LSELWRRLPEIARITYDPSLSIFVPAWCEDVPAGAEVVQVLAVCLPRLRVLHEPVERLTGVGHLRRPVDAAGDAEQRLLRRAAGGRLALRESFSYR